MHPLCHSRELLTSTWPSSAQSIVISGESGAGKSETAKKVLHFLAFAASRSGGADEGIESRILASSPLLEAFGNAKTSMNNNSSRYGKFLMLQFDNSGQLAGAHIKTYLLEKTRVVSPGPMERGYHVGYMLCQSRELAGILGLPPAQELVYLGRTGCVVSPGWDDAQELADCLESFTRIGVPPDDRDRLWRVIAALLLLGEIDFGPDDAPESKITDTARLEQMCALIDVDPEPMSRGLTIKMTKMGADWIQAPNTPARASELRHGFARSMYSTCFDWLVKQVNTSLRLESPTGGAAEPEEPSGAQQFIGILDIFGFETFQVNSLEQLCINYCNERLQSTFNEAVFQAVQEENAAEGVELPEADLSEIDNSAVVKLIGGRPNGILPALNEECVVPKGTDGTMLEKLFQAHKQNTLLSKPVKLAEGFTVKHFVGPVTYLATNILLKNKDPVSEDLMVLLQRSRSPFVQALFSATSETKTLLAKKKDTRFQGVAAKFQKQLEELLRLIGYSHMHFIRCIKPNRDKKPRMFVDELVVAQLRCSGVFEAVRVIGMGFPDRLPHFLIVGQYARMLPEDQRPEVDEEGRLLISEPDAVADILAKLDVAPEEFALGISKVFLKAGVLARLRLRQQEMMASKAKVLQAMARGFFARNRVMRLREVRQRELEEEAAQALAAAMMAEEAAREAALALERSLAIEADASAAAEGQAQAAALSAALHRDEQRRSASDAIAEAEHARSVMLHGAALGDETLAESRWRSKLRKGSLRIKLSAIAAMGGAADEDRNSQVLAEVSDARSLLTRRTTSRKLLLSEESSEPPAPTKKKGFGLNLSGLGSAMPTSLLSHRDAGGGVAPLLSARAPVRKDVKKAAAKQKKDAQWMDMVLEYAQYLGMDPGEDAELLWIAEQALRAPVPDGWEEMMDPFGDLYFFNETTSQSTRQHPMDGYYQQLYLKLRLQRAGGFAGMDLESAPPPPPVPETKGKKGRRASIQPPSRLAERGNATQRQGDSTQRWQKAGRSGSIVAALTARGETTLRDGMTTSRADVQAKHVISSVSEALEMSSPRSAKFMLDRFGLNDESKEDERCLLINPAIWRVPAEGDEVPFIECVVDQEDLGLGLTQLSLYVCLNDNNEAFALRALKRMMNQNTMYELSMSETDEVDVHYTGKLSVNARGNEFVMYDDSNDAIGIREGKARRELGLVLFGNRQLGQTLPIELVIPRVQRDGESAQFRPKALSEAMIQQYKNGKTKHLFVLKGLAQLVPGGRVQLKFRGGDHSAVVFEAYRATEDRWAVRYRHPLSAYQAFNVAIAVLHNQTTELLDHLLPLDAITHAPVPHLSTNLEPIDTLEHGYGVVYSMCVYGSRVFCGTHSGHIQQWQRPIGAPPTVIEWRAHSGTVYSLMVAGRSLVSASRDWLLRVWDLASLMLVATLPGHRGTVRCLASTISAPNTVFSGSNDHTVRVWDVNTLEDSEVLKGHRGWVRALACSTDGDRLCSASRDVRVWDISTLQCLHVLSVGHRIFCLAVCRVSEGCAQRDTLYAGCARGKIRSWRLSELAARDEQTGELPGRPHRAVRTLACHGPLLLCGDQSGGVRVWDMSMRPVQGRSFDVHTAGVRAINVDALTNVVYTAADDRCVKVWGEMPFGVI